MGAISPNHRAAYQTGLVLAAKTAEKEKERKNEKASVLGRPPFNQEFVKGKSWEIQDTLSANTTTGDSCT